MYKRQSQGGIQALSRSMFGKVIPDKSRTGEFFGFYDIFGKFSAIIGPTLVGITSTVAYDVIHSANPALDAATVEAQAAPWGVLSILIVFLIGGFTYFFVLPKYLKKD